jgi:hypothetical protein
MYFMSIEAEIKSMIAPIQGGKQHALMPPHHSRLHPQEAGGEGIKEERGNLKANRLAISS